MSKPHPKEEITFVIIKPDGVKRGLTGEIMRRIEKVGLKVIALEMDKPTKEMINEHYPKDDAWMTRIGNKALEVYHKYGYNAQETLGTDDPLEIGKMARSWSVEYLCSGSGTYDEQYEQYH